MSCERAVKSHPCPAACPGRTGLPPVDKSPIVPLLIQRLLCFFITLSLLSPALGDDWPMWRYDAQRSGASPEGIPEKLHLQWTLKFPALEPAWDEPVNQDRMPYDRAYEPIVQGDLLFFGSNRSDRVTAVNVADGTEKWRYYSDGPVRFSPRYAPTANCSSSVTTAGSPAWAQRMVPSSGDVAAVLHREKCSATAGLFRLGPREGDRLSRTGESTGLPESGRSRVAISHV